MQRKRAGPLYSRLGCGTAVVLVVVLGVILRFRGGGPFSPGMLSAAGNGNQPLSGYASHAEFEEDCAQCHAPWQGVEAERCEVCHKDTASQRLGNYGIHGRLPDSGNCESCHTEHQGRSESITRYDIHDFEHSLLTGFSLESHAVTYDDGAMACGDCHLGDSYEIALIDCQDCHAIADPIFMADHTRLYGEDCLACHDGQLMEQPFDHHSVFPLDGAHSDLACSLCHVQPIAAGTPNQCHQCHQEPEIHLGQFGLDCFRCHETAAWIPAQLTYHTFPLNHGEGGDSDCQLCHLASYSEYSCYGCHEHDPEEIREEHLDEGITDFLDCVSCHPTGLEDEAERQGSD